MEDINAFRSSSRPLTTLWSFGDVQAYGTLTWIDGTPRLTLVLEVEDHLAQSGEDADLPILRATNPPIQPTVLGKVPRFGTVSLERCFQHNISISHDFQNSRALYQIELLPAAVWIGSPIDAVDGHIIQAVISDTRLVGFFGSPGMTTYHRFDPEHEKIFESLDHPDTIWTVHSPDSKRFELGTTGWLLSVTSDVLRNFSATEGFGLRSTINLRLNAPTASRINDTEQFVYRVAQILSTFSIERFSFQFERYLTNNCEEIAVVWRLGEKRSLFHAPMHHQILIDLRDEGTFKAVCKGWFSSTEVITLSRWLFVKAIEESDDGLARFIAVAQAFEVIGRELGPNDKLPKKALSKVVDLVREALHKHSLDSLVDRISNLIQSSNKSSFRDTLYHMLVGLASQYALGSESDVRNFAKNVADTRNSVVHMNDSDNKKLNDAFARVNKLSLQLCFWYAMLQANILGIETLNAREFLFNNRNVRHGLPNDVLEKI